MGRNFPDDAFAHEAVDAGEIFLRKNRSGMFLLRFA
jgi:hypothetical protein